MAGDATEPDEASKPFGDGFLRFLFPAPKPRPAAQPPPPVPPHRLMTLVAPPRLEEPRLFIVRPIRPSWLPPPVLPLPRQDSPPPPPPPPPFPPANHPRTRPAGRFTRNGDGGRGGGSRPHPALTGVGGAGSERRKAAAPQKQKKEKKADGAGHQPRLDQQADAKSDPSMARDHGGGGGGELNQAPQPNQARGRRRHGERRRDMGALTPGLLALYESLKPSEEHKGKQKQLVDALASSVAREWPHARLHLYGSCANAFGSSHSDVDVCLEMEIAGDAAEVILRLADVLRADKFENVEAITGARVPIVRMSDPGTGISCDICINNLFAVANTKLLRDYAQIDERLPQLAFLVKHWARVRGVNETYRGTLSSYAYVLMCINFLQQREPQILPCLQAMEPTYKMDVDGAECAYFDRVDELHGFGAENRESIGELLRAFFHHWAFRHNYKHDVVSVRLGKTISKKEKEWTGRVGSDRHLASIEDPFEAGHDLGRVVDWQTIGVLREEFRRAAAVLQYDDDPCVALFEPYDDDSALEK